MRQLGQRPELDSAGDHRYLTDLLGRAVPAVGFGVLWSAQLVRTWATVETAARHGATTVDVLAVLNSAVVLGFYALLVVLYAVRLPRVHGDQRPRIVLAALGGTFLVMTVPFLPGAPRRDWLLLPADLVALAGGVVALWALIHLRRSFSILPQSRRLVTGGPYALSRNPMYVGEFLAWSALLPSIGWAGVPVLAVCAALQLVRVRAEEQVLARTFGAAYAGYRRRVRRWWGRY